MSCRRYFYESSAFYEFYESLKNFLSSPNLEKESGIYFDVAPYALRTLRPIDYTKRKFYYAIGHERVTSFSLALFEAISCRACWCYRQMICGSGHGTYALHVRNLPAVMIVT